MSWIFNGPPDDTPPRRFAPVAISAPRGLNRARQFVSVWTDDDGPTQTGRKFAPLAPVSFYRPAARLAGAWIDDDAPQTLPRRFAPVAPYRGINPAKRGFDHHGGIDDGPADRPRRFGQGFTATIPPYVATGPRAKIFAAMVAAGAWDEAWPEQSRAYWQASVPVGDTGKSAALTVTFGGASGSGGGTYVGAGSGLSLGFVGMGASGVLSISGKNDWTPVLEVQLAIDATGRVLLIDVTGRVLDVSAGNNGWIGATAAKNV